MSFLVADDDTSVDKDEKEESKSNKYVADSMVDKLVATSPPDVGRLGRDARASNDFFSFCRTLHFCTSGGLGHPRHEKPFSFKGEEEYHFAVFSREDF